MQSQGYDKLSDDANKNLEQTLRYVEGNAQEQERIVSQMLTNISGHYKGAYDNINGIIQNTGTVIGTTAQNAVNNLEATLKPLRDAAQLALTVNNASLSTFNTSANSAATNISTEPITTNGNTTTTTTANNILNSHVSGGNTSGTPSNGTRSTNIQETATQANKKRQVNSNITSFINTRKAATSDRVTANAKDELWTYIQQTTGKDVSDWDMLHIGHVLGLSDLPSENVSDRSKVKLTNAQKTRILGALKKQNWGKNEKTMTYAMGKKGATKARVNQMSNDALWMYVYERTGKDLNEKELWQLGKEYNVPGLPSDYTKMSQTNRLDILETLKRYGFGAKEQITNYINSRNRKASQDEVTKKKADALWYYIYQKSKGGQNASEFDMLHVGKILGVENLPSEADAKKDPNNFELKKNQKDAILKALKASGYKRGTLSVPKSGNYWTHEGEIIRRSDGAILRNLPQGSQVIPANLSENLMKWGAISPDNIGNILTSGLSAVNTNSSSTVVNNSYGSLLTVNGNVDQTVLPELKEILKQACEYTNKYNAREARKLGKK